MQIVYKKHNFILSNCRVELVRITTSTLFGADSPNLTLEVEYQSDYRLRIKVIFLGFSGIEKRYYFIR
jgi:hypothetical protein